MSSRIYLVKTPAGQRLVESGTKGQAINHCVSSDYSAEPISAADLHAYLQAGAAVEKAVTKEKKSEAGAGAGQLSSMPQVGSILQPSSGALPGSAATQAPGGTPVSQPVPQSLPSSVASPSTAMNLASTAGALNAAPTPNAVAASNGSWNPPQQGNELKDVPAFIANSNPVLAEQQRINPDAARAAGILPLAPAANAPPADAAGAGWVQRN